MEKKKECMLCFNTKEEELERVTLYSDGDGNDCIELEYMCKEGMGCS